MGSETIYLEEYVTVHGLLSRSFMSLYLYCSNKYNSICTHLIKHLINVFFFKKKFHIKTSDQNKTCLYKNKSTQQPFGLGAMKLM